MIQLLFSSPKMYKVILREGSLKELWLPAARRSEPGGASGAREASFPSGDIGLRTETEREAIWPYLDTRSRCSEWRIRQVWTFCHCSFERRDRPRLCQHRVTQFWKAPTVLCPRNIR